MSDRNACETPIHFQPFDKDALADKFEGGHLFQDAVVCRFVERNGMLSLVFDFSFRPLLLLCGFSTAGCWGCFSFGLQDREHMSAHGDIQIDHIQSMSKTPSSRCNQFKEQT
jgi:hypothetical protein